VSLRTSLLMIIALVISTIGITQSGFTNSSAIAQQCDLAPVQSDLDAVNEAACLNTSEHVTWLTWLSGNSRSTQFHFLDLIELFYNSGSSSSDSASPNFPNNTR